MLAAVLLPLLPTMPAHAGMEVGMQDDQAVVYQWHDRDLALRQFRTIGGTHVRMNVTHRYGPIAGPQGLQADSLVHPLSKYADAIAAVHEAGLTPQVTLAWYGHDNPDDISSWMGAVAERLAATVDRYSVLNEPDLTLHASDECTPQRISELVTTGALEIAYKTVAVKQFLRHRVRIRRDGKVFRAWRPVYRRVKSAVNARGKRALAIRKIRKYRWTSKKVAVTKTVTNVNERESLSLKNGCLFLTRGRKYREIFQLSARAIRASDDGAQVLAGETSPHQGFPVFVNASLPLDADGWAHHPYQWDLEPKTASAVSFGIGNTALIAAMVDMPLYYTEFGYPRAGTPWELELTGGIYTESALARALPQAWDLARSRGVRQMLQYGWFSPAAGWKGRWNTSILNSDDGSTTPAFDALKASLQR